MKISINLIALLACLALCFGAAGIGAAFTSPSIPGWYASLSKPDWNPPNWIFGPVWSFLYICMAVAAWLVWCRRGVTAVAVPLGVFGMQLLLNTAWSVLFFGLHQAGLAFAEILVLDITILVTLVLFWRISSWAGMLLVPYLFWVSFAAFLNFSIWRMNR